MELEFRHLITFQTIVEEGSFVRAAEKLNYSQATITLQIQQLEELLGLQVFSRENKRRLQLTEAGRLLLSHANHVHTQMDTLQRSMSGLKTGEIGHLRIGGIEPLVSLLFPTVIQAFLKTYPQVRISLETRGTTGIHGMVSNEEVDLGLTTPPPSRAGLRFDPLFTEVIVALVPEFHPLSQESSIPAEALGSTKIILTNPTCAYRELIERILMEHGVRLDATLEIGSLSALKQMVQAGLGIALLPGTAARDIPAGTVVRKIDQLDLQISIGLVYKSWASLPLQPNTITHFVALLKQALLMVTQGE